MAEKISIGSLFCLAGGIVMIVAGVLAAFNITFGYNSAFRGADVTSHGGMISPIFGILIIVSALLTSIKPEKKILWHIVIGLCIIANIYVGYDIYLIGSALSIFGVCIHK